MANTTGLPVLLATGIHSARPAASAVGSGGLYSCTTHSLIYQTDGSSWTTWAAVGGSSTRASLGLDTTDSPEFAGLNVGAATDTTITRTGAGEIAVEGNRIFRVGGADVPIADGGTGASTKAAAFDALSPMTTQDDIVIGGASGTGTRLAKGSDGQVLTVDPTTHHLVWATPAGGGGGGSSIDWNQLINEDGSSFANFTASSGTWASSGGKIAQTDASGAVRMAKHNTLIPLGFGWIIEAVINVVTTTGDPRQAGLAITNGSSGGLWIFLWPGHGVQVDIQGVANIRTLTTTITHATDYKLRVVCAADWYSIYLDGTLLGNIPHPVGIPAASEFVSLVSYAASVTWDDIKAWVLSTGAPA